MKSITRSTLLTIAVSLGIFANFSSQAQVVINEFCTANYTDWIISGENEDWVELYNPTATAINISGYFLSDNPANPQKWPFPAGSTVPANGYLMVLLSGTGEYDPNYLGYRNTNFKVTQTAGESLLFSNTSGTILEQYDLSDIGPFQANHSYARTSDGGATWAIHSDPSPNASNSGPNYTAYAARPIFSQQAGYYNGAISVTLTAEPGASIYYTTNGANPTTASTLYTGPIALSTTTTLRAISVSSDNSIFNSLIETNTYFFGNDQHSILTVNIAGPTLSDGQWFGDEACHIEFFQPGGVFITEAGGDSNEHGNDSNAYPQRGFDYVTRDAMGYDNQVEHAIFGHSDRSSFERLIFKAAANDQYPTAGGAHLRDAYVCELSILGGLNLDERKSEFCVLYINGAYWGVYDVREKVDDTDYCKYYYDQPAGFIDFIKTWGGTWTEYGSSADWNTLRNFITSNDMTVQANYDYVLTQYDHMSLIDYFILNGYVVCTDWLNWNTAWWRGRHPQGQARKWRYTLWDNDATFGHYINYTNVPSDAPDASPCQVENMGDVGGQGHIPILNALFDNPNFLADYVQRYASLSNSIFSCEQMIHVLDSMADVIAPEMQRQCTRWGGNVNSWQVNVQEIRDFILLRCNNEIIGGIEDCYDVTAYTVTVQMEGQGDIIFETLPFNETNLPFTGTYFGGLPIDIQAIVADGGALCGSFVGWEIISGNGTIADPSNPITTLTISGDVTLVAHFQEPNNGPVYITTQISEPGAGTITLNGTPQVNLPSTTEIVGGETNNVSVSTNEWYVFEHWESSQGTTLTPSNTATTITLSLCNSDTLTAVFTAIPHFTLTVGVGTPGGGYVVFGQDTIFNNGNTYTLEGNLNYNFAAYPMNEWWVFSHWETTGGNPISPEDLDPAIVLQLLASGSLTAIFNPIPHHTITVVVDPPFAAGNVVFQENHLNGSVYTTSTTLTTELEGNKLLLFEAEANPFWKFKGWTSNHHSPSPNEDQEKVNFKFMSSDTIVAHFTQEEFQVFIPNSFTPNQDGKNDVFQIEGSAIDEREFHLRIFNRWGDLVFETYDIHTAWVGNVEHGKYYYAMDEVYPYILTIKSVHEINPREMTGTITVLR